MAEKTVVFITGANTGIGYETVRALVGQDTRGYHVLLGSRSIEKGNAVAESLRTEFPDTTSVIDVVQIDVSSDESINAAYETVKAGPGYLDVLVNNAGTYIVCYIQRLNFETQGYAFDFENFLPVIIILRSACH